MAPAIDGEKVTVSVQLAPAISVEVLVHGVAPLPADVLHCERFSRAGCSGSLASE
jgi:hypothetical protein